MIGTFRLMLALFVAVFHVGGFPLPFGIYSVMAFYAISGFLMTRVLNDAYLDNKLKFWCNRFLKLYPQYYIVAIITLIAIVLFPDSAKLFHIAWNIDKSRGTEFANIFIVPLAFQGFSHFRLVPPTWSLGVEIINYFVLSVFAARSVKCAAAMLLASALYHGFTLWSGEEWPVRYYPWYAAALPFALGCIGHFAFESISPEQLPHRLKVTVCGSALALMAVNFGVACYVGPTVSTSALSWYANLVLVVISVGFLATIRPNAFLSRIDRHLGDVAYPVFLTHWLLGFIVSLSFPILKPGTPELFLGTLLPLLGLSIALALMFEKILEPIRSLIRGRSRRSNADPGRALSTRLPTS